MNETDSDVLPKRKPGRPRKTESFLARIEQIETAKKRSEKFFKESLGEEKTPQAVLNMAWEVVFDFFLRAREECVDVSELNTLAGIVQKLVSSTSSLAGAELKAPKKRGCASGLTEDGLREIERKLKLL